MTKKALIALTEDELDTLVSIAIRRAEILDDAGLPMANDAWHEVMVYEERLAMITCAAEITGGIARVGAVRAALAGGRRLEAARLASQYLAEDSLPAERRMAIEQAFHEDRNGVPDVFQPWPGAVAWLNWTNGELLRPKLRASSRGPHDYGNRCILLVQRRRRAYAPRGEYGSVPGHVWA